MLQKIPPGKTKENTPKVQPEKRNPPIHHHKGKLKRRKIPVREKTFKQQQKKNFKKIVESFKGGRKLIKQNIEKKQDRTKVEEEVKSLEFEDENVKVRDSEEDVRE